MRLVLITYLVTALAAAAFIARAQSLPPYGEPNDIAFANNLWPALAAAEFVGKDRRNVWPREGEDPHGNMAQVVAGKVRVANRTARVIVKANHRGEGLKAGDVYSEPNRFLTGYAVMFAREAGYHPEANDWFWVVYRPDGSVAKFQDRAIAGRIDTGKENGCIGCHRKYGGRDFETLTSR